MEEIDYTSIFYFTDLLNLLAEYLCYVDIQALSLACPTIRKYLNKNHCDVQKIVLKRLCKKLRIKYANEFNDNLTKYKHFISGSFILQCLYDVIWDPSDIDVYTIDVNTFEDNVKKWDEDSESFLMYGKRKFKYNLKYRGPIDRIMKYLEIGMHVRQYAFPNSEQKVLDYITVSKLPDIILKRPFSSILDFLDQRCDMTICKVVYNGTKIFIKHFNDIITKTTISTPTAYNLFSQIGWEHFILLQLVENRVIKYQNRGFNIKRDYDYELENKLCIADKKEREEIELFNTFPYL